MTDAESLYETTKNMADQALREAQEAYDDSLDIFSTAESIVLPNIDVDIMKDDAQDIKDEVRVSVLWNILVIDWCWQSWSDKH